MSTYNWLDLQTLGSLLVMPKILPDHRFGRWKSGSPNLESLRPFLRPSLGIQASCYNFKYCLYIYEMAKSLLIFFYIELRPCSNFRIPKLPIVQFHILVRNLCANFLKLESQLCNPMFQCRSHAQLFLNQNSFVQSHGLVWKPCSKNPSRLAIFLASTAWLDLIIPN